MKYEQARGTDIIAWDSVSFIGGAGVTEIHNDMDLYVYCVKISKGILTKIQNMLI